MAVRQLHTDPGLQPERTTLAWGRTMMALVAASLLFLRWLPEHGAFVGVPVGVALAAALAINASQRARYRHSSTGIHREQARADVVAVFVTAGVVSLLAGLGIYTVAFLPLAD